MNLTIDIGNTSVKAGIFSGRNLQEIWTYPFRRISDFQKIASDFPEITHCIVSTVVDLDQEFSETLGILFKTTFLDQNTSIPIQNLYKTPDTLGKDRLASAIAGASLHSGKNILIVEAGTCLKCEFIDNQGNYHGGSISPGLNMRFKALNQFTDKLPLIHPSDFDKLVGTNTKDSILSGVINGIIAEVDGMIDHYKKKYPDIIVLASGGDHNFFAGKLKNSIFAVPNLVLYGLNEILNYNVQNT